MTVPRQRVSPLDRERADSCIVSAVGPMTMPSVEVVRNRLIALAAMGPHTRVGLRPSAGSLLWSYEPADLFNCVESILPATLADLDDVMSRIAQRYRHEGIRVYIAGDFLLIAVSHGLCDARLLVLLQNVLLSSAPPTWAGGPPAKAMLSSATVRWFGARPRRLVELMQLPRAKVPEPVALYRTDELPPAQLTLRWTSIPPEARNLMLFRMAAYAPHATEAAMWFSTIAKALKFSKVDISQEVVVLVDARRYRPDANPYFANFAMGLEFDFADPYDPEDLSHQVQMAMRAGRPLAAMSLAALKSLKPARDNSKRIAMPSRPVVSFSDIGRAVDERSLPWRTHERAYIATTEGVGYNGISFILVEVGKSVLVQCSFNAVVHPPEQIESMLALLTERSAELYVGSVDD